MDTPFYQYKDFMLKRYGAALFRVPIDFGLSCPNRNSDGTGGCSFCSEKGGRSMQTLKQDSVEDQLKEAIFFAKKRYRAKKFMAYFQAFTANFNPKQTHKYLKLLNSFNFSAVSIATRPDCLKENAFVFLTKLNKTLETWVELGVQTVHNKTLKLINRGHLWQESKTAIVKLHSLNIKNVVHLIIGLPGETNEDFLITAKTLAELPIDGIKIHNLHIIKNTQLAKDYSNKSFPIFNEYEFGEKIMEFLRYIPANIPIMRINTDSLNEELIAPKWHMSKLQFREYIIKQMNYRNWQQGDKTASPPKKIARSLFTPIKTKDKSITFWNNNYKEHYHSTSGAILEAKGKYIEPGKLKEKLIKKDVKLLDVCFGMGYNSIEAVKETIKYTGKLEITALEMEMNVIQSTYTQIKKNKNDNLIEYQIMQKINNEHIYTLSLSEISIAIKLLLGDARYTITKLNDSYFDLVFLDAFSTLKNSELWTVEFFKKLKRIMNNNALLLTYSAAFPVRSGLIQAGFFIGETRPVGRKRSGTIASLNEKLILKKISQEELNHYQSTRGIPYLDPHGTWSNKEILRDRQERIKIFKSQKSHN